MIDCTAVVSPDASVDPTATVGPYAVIDPGVVVGPECVVGPYVYLTGRTRVGARNRFHAGCVVGDAPQDVKYDGAPTGLSIGDDNVFREHVTVHRSNTLAESTLIGAHNLFMAHAHVGHNARIGDHVIVANGALLGGHVEVADRVFISGNCLIHQFVRIGTLALLQGGAAIGKDLPPFMIASGANSICGLNTVGLRRAGVVSADRLALRHCYHQLFRGAGSPRLAAAALLQATKQEPGSQLNERVRQLVEFVLASRRGVCTHGRRRRDTDDATG